MSYEALSISPSIYRFDSICFSFHPFLPSELYSVCTKMRKHLDRVKFALALRRKLMSYAKTHNRTQSRLAHTLNIIRYVYVMLYSNARLWFLSLFYLFLFFFFFYFMECVYWLCECMKHECIIPVQILSLLVIFNSIKQRHRPIFVIVVVG